MIDKDASDAIEPFSGPNPMPASAASPDPGPGPGSGLIPDRNRDPTLSPATAEPENGPRSENRVDFNANFEAKIKNPLLGIPRDTLMRDVEQFAREKHLEAHIPILRKGALVAQNPKAYRDIGGSEALAEDEIAVLRKEADHKWRVPARLYLTILTCSIGAAVQGWDQTGSNGANLDFPQAFHIDSGSVRDELIIGLVNSAPYFASAVVGCWLSDPLNFYFGRRGTIFFSAHFCLWPVIGSAFCQTWEQLFVCRVLLGLGMGSKASTVPIFAAENSPAAIRGALVMTWQLYVALGILLGTCANLAVVNIPDVAWRYQLGSAFIPALPLLFLIYLCPESPRWYIKKNRYADAMRSLLLLRNHPIQAARDIYYIHAQLAVERDVMGTSNYVTRFFDLFRVPRLRRAFGAAFVVMIGQQLCGINIIAFYSSTVFRNAGASNFEALLASFGFGLVNFLFAWPAIWTIDTFGRRSLLLFTFPNMAWTLLAAGLCTLIPGTRGAHLGLVALFVYLFAAFYSPGEGPVPFAYSAEVFPLSHREVGMAISVATNLFWAGILGMFFPLMLESMGVIGAFGFYAGLNVLGFIMIFLWVPETKQRTLEELDYIFAVPSRIFTKYQLTKTIPFWIMRYVFWQRKATIEPLYRFELDADDNNDDNVNDHPRSPTPADTDKRDMSTRQPSPSRNTKDGISKS